MDNVTLISKYLKYYYYPVYTYIEVGNIPANQQKNKSTENLLEKALLTK